MKRIAVIGSHPPKERYLQLYFTRVLRHVVDYVNKLPHDVIVVSGGTHGVDLTAANAARYRGLHVVEHLPTYRQYNSKLVPLVKNQMIVDDCDVLVAFPTSWSTGTWHAIRLAKKAGKELELYQIEMMSI